MLTTNAANKESKIVHPEALAAQMCLMLNFTMYSTFVVTEHLNIADQFCHHLLRLNYNFRVTWYSSEEGPVANIAWNLTNIWGEGE